MNVSTGFHIHLRRTAAACLLSICLTALPAAADEALLVDLNGVDVNGLEQLKRAPGSNWWLEIGEVLLLAGDAERLRSHLGQRVLRDLGEIRVDELALHARGCGDNSQRIPAELLVLPGDAYDLVRRPRSFSSVGPRPDENRVAHLGAAEWLPVEPNTVIARWHRFDRPRGVVADPLISPVVQAVDAARWFATVENLAAFDRSSFSAELPMAREWIAAEFEALGLTVTHPGFTFPPGNTPAPIANVIGMQLGSEFPDDWIIVGGHYDSRNTDNSASGAKNTPGADDNASGCGGVIEAARALVPFRPRSSVMFICYAGEEQGLYGSKGHVAALVAANQIGQVRAMLNMDMIGWLADATVGVSIGVATNVGDAEANVALRDLIADSATAYVPELTHVVTSTNTCCSDHMPYLNAGRPAAHSIHRGGTAYPHYHRDSDTPANLGSFAQTIGGAIVRMNVAALAQLSGASDRIFADGSDAKP